MNKAAAFYQGSVGGCGAFQKKEKNCGREEEIFFIHPRAGGKTAET
jgi:hypothetical protein